MQKEKEFVEFQINNSNNNLNNVIKLENIDEIDHDLGDNFCNVQENDVKPIIKKIVNKNICYKCKENKSNYFNRGEYICK
jgi:hypothetical protein